MHRLDLLARLLDLRSTDHPTTGPVVLGDDASEENYELDAVLEALTRRLIDCEHRTADALMNAAHAHKAVADLHADNENLREQLRAHNRALIELRHPDQYPICGPLDAVRAYVKEAGLD